MVIATSYQIENQFKFPSSLSDLTVVTSDWNQNNFLPSLSNLKISLPGFSHSNEESFPSSPNLTNLSVVLCKNNTCPPSLHLSSLTHLTLFLSGSKLDTFPPNLVYLKLKISEKCVGSLPAFPTSLKYLKITSLDVIPPLTLPSNLLSFCGKWDARCSSSLPSSFPSSLLSLSLPFVHSTPISSFPPNLTKLRCSFQCAIDCDFPSSLRDLSLPYDYKNVVHSLPPLTHLNFKPPFKQEQLACPLPLSLNHLHIHFYIPEIKSLPSLTNLFIFLNTTPNYPLEFPSSLRVLRIGITSKVKIIFPPSLTQLVIENGEIESLPPSLTHLTVCSPNLLPPLPTTLTHFTTDSNFQSPLPTLPPFLHTLEINPYGEQYLHNLPVLPKGLRHLILPSAYSYPLPNIPSSLSWLKCGEKWLSANSQILPEWCSVTTFKAPALGFFA